jgi:hypothetical protein
LRRLRKKPGNRDRNGGHPVKYITRAGAVAPAPACYTLGMLETLIVDFVIFVAVGAAVLFFLHVVSTLWYTIRGFRCRSAAARARRDDPDAEFCSVCGDRIGQCD